MPEISRFFGMVIAMYYNDHDPPHFHVRYGGRKGIIAIDPPAVLGGDLPPRASALTLEWAMLHRDELLADWVRSKHHMPLDRIPPLE
jgi:hypothetical protein